MADSLGNGAILCEIDQRGVATITFNRPQVNNAYNGDFIDGVLQALDLLGAQKGLRCVLLRGNGRHFQAGADLTWIRGVSGGSVEDNEAASRQTAEAVRRLDAAPVPVIALVQGGCFGGGTGIVAACDVVIASEDAIFSISETRWGLMAGIILPQLVQAIGLRQVRRYALTGERFDAQEARRIGLVHEVVPTGGLDAAAARMADQILMNAPLATAQTKHTARAAAGAEVAGWTFDALVREHAAKRRSAEAAEGLDSFRERRKPRWYPT
jgi:methylglutaconyl-CoA hydratase